MKRNFIFLSAFLSVLLLFSSFSVKASSVTSFPAFPEPVEGKSSTHYVIMYRDSGPEQSYYYLIKPLTPNSLYIERGSEDILKFAGPAIDYKWIEGTNSWSVYSEPSVGSQRTLYESYTILYSSFDLCYEDGSVFFQKAPIRESFLDQMKKVKMGATLKTLVLLIPLLMVLVVSFLAFRKALAMLLKVLRKA